MLTGDDVEENGDFQMRKQRLQGHKKLQGILSTQRVMRVRFILPCHYFRFDHFGVFNILRSFGSRHFKKVRVRGDIKLFPSFLKSIVF